MLVVYDEKGTIYFAGIGYPEPVGIPFLNAEIPEGQYIESVDVSSEPHKPVFKEYPKSEMELLKERIAELEKGQTALVEGAQSAIK